MKTRRNILAQAILAVHAIAILAGGASGIAPKAPPVEAWSLALLDSPLQSTPHEDAARRHRLPAPVTDDDFIDGGAPARDKVELGRMLFFDKVISGNQNVSCATCHHPKFATSDGVSLAFGEGASGLGPDRAPGASLDETIHERVPRNSPALFNLGAKEFEVLFHDGRVEADEHGWYEGGFITPAKWKLPQGLENVLAAQAMFPVTSPAEMAGQKSENTIADARSLNNAAGKGGVWEQIAGRLRAIPEYVTLFERAFPGEVNAPEDITFVRAANAIAAFEAEAFRADNSPFDRYLRGDDKSMTAQQKRGMELFYGTADCASCHVGKFQTDHDFHAIAMPQVGPGKNDGSDDDYWNATGHSAFVEDFGRGRVTVRPEDNYKFRTLPLRNVELTGPWGHAGAYPTLEDVVRHHIDPVKCLEEYEPAKANLPPVEQVAELTATGSKLEHSYLGPNRLAGFLERDTWVQRNDDLRSRIAAANELKPAAVDERAIDDLVAFLKSLTDPASRDLTHLIPDRVPSGLPVDR